MKKTLCLIIATVMALSLIACSTPAPDYDSDQLETTEDRRTEPETEATQTPPSDPTEPQTSPTEPIPTESPETLPSEETLPNIEDLVVDPQPDNEPVSPQGDIVNILLIGEDQEADPKHGRSDTMILVTFNRSNGSITMTSFMRDALVQIPGYSPYKLNAAYQYGGMTLLNDTLYANFGVEIHGDVAVNFEQFKALIDTLGGVEIELTQEEADYLNEEHGWSLTNGTCLLNGEEALAYCRIRSIDNDYQRSARQRKLLMSLIDQYKGMSTMEMLDKLDDLVTLIATNMEKSEIISLAMDLFPMLSTATFDTAQIPAEGTFTGGNVQVRPGLKEWFQYDIDFAANREILQEIFDAD